MYTYNGDANLSGRVDADDYFAIDARYNHSGSEFGFARGDFNYDGMINGDDYMLIDYAYVAQTAAFPSATTAAIAVPEPASLAIVALGALLCAKRRRIA
jgi:hypothetical protein